MKTIKIATEYSDTPLGRVAADGDYNGTRFREEFLRPALTSETAVIVNLDDVEGMGSSFLEEAFGGLVRCGYFSAVVLREKLKIQFKDEDNEIYRDLIWKYIGEAKAEQK